MGLVSRSRDWMRQSVRDLAHAEASLKRGHYEWACFAAQQAAEKTVKALYESRNTEALGGSASRWLEHLPEELRPSTSLGLSS
ncbi:MAG: HEPN domain-containing protein [Nitrososphaerota archaeon]